MSDANVSKELMDKIFSYIDNLAAAAQEGAKFGWAIMVKQAYVEGAVILLIMLLCLVSIYACYRVYSVREKYKAEYGDYNTPFILDFAQGASAVISVLLFMYSICRVSTLLTVFINPEYWVIMKLLGKM